jgi:hypothetical protein
LLRVVSKDGASAGGGSVNTQHEPSESLGGTASGGTVYVDADTKLPELPEEKLDEKFERWKTDDVHDGDPAGKIEELDTISRVGLSLEMAQYASN